MIQYGYVSPNYFDVMGIPLIEGRAFDTADDARAAGVAIIDRELARQLFPAASAVGRQLVGFGTIVGVVGSVKTLDLAAPAQGAVYRPFLQFPDYEETVLVRTELEPSALAVLARNIVRELDDEVAVFEVTSMRSAIQRTLGGRYLALGVLGSVGALALLLAALGIHAVLSHGVRRRTREIGIRLALGATPRAVTRSVVRSGFVLALVGLGVGGLLYLAARRLLSSLVFDVSTLDPTSFVAGAVVLAGVALAATLVPAWRASRSNPISALRED